MPKRIQRKRVKGWRKPPDAVSVCRPGPFGNQFRLGYAPPFDTPQSLVDAFETWLLQTPEGRALAERAKRELRGHDLLCWCAVGSPCHADVLLRIANEEAAE